MKRCDAVFILVWGPKKMLRIIIIYNVSGYV